jgi:hypothetical protein
MAQYPLGGVCPECGERAVSASVLPREEAACGRGHRWTRCPLCRAVVPIPPGWDGTPRECADCRCNPPGED